MFSLNKVACPFIQGKWYHTISNLYELHSNMWVYFSPNWVKYGQTPLVLSTFDPKLGWNSPEFFKAHLQAHQIKHELKKFTGLENILFQKGLAWISFKVGWFDEHFFFSSQLLKYILGSVNCGRFFATVGALACHSACLCKIQTVWKPPPC